MIYKSLLAASAFALIAGAAHATEYGTDQGHTEVRFGWNHAGVSIQTAEFNEAKGLLKLDPDNPSSAALNVSIDTDSLASGFGPLDDHLKSADFLNVEKYPEITFVSTGIEMTGEKTANVNGNLTIHGVTQPVSLETELTHIGDHPLGSRIDYYKGKWVAFKASTEIDHMSFGVGSFSTGPISIEIVTEMKEVQ